MDSSIRSDLATAYSSPSTTFAAKRTAMVAPSGRRMPLHSITIPAC